MFSLRAPISAQVQLAGPSAKLAVPQWLKIIAQLTPLLNEVKLSGVGTFLQEGGELDLILGALEKGQKFYHIYIEDDFLFSGEKLQTWLEQMRSLAYFGSFICKFPPSAALLLSQDECLPVTSTEAASPAQRLSAFVYLAIEAGFEVNFQTIISQDNYQQLESIAELTSQAGVNYTIFERQWGESSSLSELKLKESLNTYDELKRNGYNVALAGCIPNCFHNSGSYGCMGGILSAWVDPQGQLKPCERAESVGSLLENTLEELWQNSAMQAWRQHLPSQCLQCSKLNYCPGGCRALGKGTASGFDPLVSGPLEDDRQVLQEVTLEEDLFPQPLYTVRQESFGWALIKANRAIPVTTKAGKVLAMFDGKHTLGDIEETFGSASLSFVYSLYVRGFIELKSTPLP